MSLPATVDSKLQDKLKAMEGASVGRRALKQKAVSKVAPKVAQAQAASLAVVQQEKPTTTVYSAMWSPATSSVTRHSSSARSDLEAAAKQGTLRCRIPQRLQQTGAKPPSSATIPKARSSYGESSTRPKSGNKLKDEILYQNKSKYLLPRSVKPNERVSPAAKRPSVLPRKANQRPIIMVPMTQSQKSPVKSTAKNSYSNQGPPQGDTTSVQGLDRLSPVSGYDLNSEIDTISSRGDKLVELKIVWQDKIVQYEHMKGDLNELQKNILELYAKMQETQVKMCSLGEDASLPPAEDLRIMNVSNMTPGQLLQLCAGDDSRGPRLNGVTLPETIDLGKLYEMPSRLVNTCEQTLEKRKEIIDWFESLKSMEKGISVHKLSKKINEFNAENDMLKCTLDNSKNDFLKELEEIVAFIRSRVNETMTLQLRLDQLTLEMSQLNSQNIDLRKQMSNADHCRSQINKNRVEELEKELKEEKCKRLFMRDRLARSDGQVKINVERATQLEATLEQARTQIWSLERTVQNLHEQNEKLQSDFDKELSKLTESIREHTLHLEEIAEAREKLQSEKDELENRLAELSAYYNESLLNTKKEIASHIAKLIETEKKYEEQSKDKKNLEVKLEVLCGQLVEAERRYNTVYQELQQKEVLYNKGKEADKEIEVLKFKLEEANNVITETKNQLAKQNEAMEETRRSLKEAQETIETLNIQLSNKNECIDALENKNSLLEQQLQENEHKMEAYVEQLTSLKDHINQLQEEFGEFENLNELHEMLNNQRTKLLESTRQNEELAEALQKKDKEIEQYNESLSEHEQLLLEREGVIKMLSEKEEEQSNIIKILRNNLELRSQTDNDLNQQVMEKNTEIESLLVNLNTRKQQISNMEKIILTLEDQTRKASLQRKKDQDHILLLQKKISEYKAMQLEATSNINSNDNLDSLIKILEDELNESAGNEQCSKNNKIYQNNAQKKSHRDRKRDQLEYYDGIGFHSRYQTESDPLPTKIVMENYAKKLFDEVNEEQCVGDNLDRKKAITNIDAQKMISAPEHGYDMHSSAGLKENIRHLMPSPPQASFFSRNLPYLNSDQPKSDKKHKMFKFAGHRL